jgi:hypothetical protein
MAAFYLVLFRSRLAVTLATHCDCISLVRSPANLHQCAAVARQEAPHVEAAQAINPLFTIFINTLLKLAQCLQSPIQENKTFLYKDKSPNLNLL